MRRTEREMLEPEFLEAVLNEAQEIYIALNTGAAPYVLPVNFVYHEGDIYFHCATEGRKLDLLRVDPQIGFTAAVDIMVEKTTTRYRSVCGTGRAALVTEPDHKNGVLRAFAAKYKAPCHFPVSEEKFAITAVVRIVIEEMTGKFSRPSEAHRPMPHYER